MASIEQRLENLKTRRDGGSAREVDQNGFIHIEKNPISRAGVFSYLASSVDPNHPEPNSIVKVLRPPEELDSEEAKESFKLIPFIDDHEMLAVGDPNITAPEKRGVHGSTGENITFEGGVLYSNLKIFSNYLKNNVDSGKRDLSLGYRCTYEKSPGTYNGESYDYIQRNLRGNHLALVDKARCDVSVLDNHFTFDRCDLALDLKEYDMAEKTAEEKEKETKDAADRAARDEKMDKVCDWAMSKMDEEKTAKDAAEKERMLNEGKDAGAKSRVTDEDKDKEAKEKEAKDKAAKDAEEKEKKDKESMDAAIKQIPSIAQDIAALKSGTFAAAMMNHVRDRDQLAQSLSHYVGTFAHDSMTLEGVAAYGAEKLKLGCPKGQEVTAVKAFLHGRTPNSEVRIGFDSFTPEGGKSKLDSFLDNMTKN